MNEIILDEEPFRQDLFPFTCTRPVIDIRVGILTLREKWEKLFGYTPKINSGSAKNLLPATIIPSADLVHAIKNQKEDQYLKSVDDLTIIKYPWDIFLQNNKIICSDFLLITQGRVTEPISATNTLIQPENIFIEKGAKVEYALLNGSTGPIYIGKNAEVMEGAMIRGPFALCEGAVVKMGAKIYGSTIGPYSVVGGEIKNSVIFGFSNKAHDGYLGDSVIGEWCNLGAGTSNSNVKNTAGTINVWNIASGKFLPAGLKCGLLMGDYSRSAINTSFNTGSVVGVCCNVFGEGLSPKYIPDFSWGYNPFTQYHFEKAIKDITNWKKLKNQSVDDMEIRTLKHIFEETKTNRE
ncbi:MAG: glucose-1-phosphate thymidylyltransferase [Bacteroidetes bacterium]|nr:glucose-1-phosphate thymidylyltransferase [Bacteroidota bacterium]